MKISSEYLEIDIDPKFSCQDGKLKISKTDVTIWDDGDIELEKGDNDIWLNYNELVEIVMVAKRYKGQRDAYLASIK